MAEANGDIKLIRWETLTKRRFDELDRQRCVVVVTCSPLEVHGPHLPLGADALEGEGLLERTLSRLPERHRDRVFLKLPFIYTATDVVPHPGSIFFQPSTHRGAPRPRTLARGAGLSRCAGVELFTAARATSLQSKRRATG